MHGCKPHLQKLLGWDDVHVRLHLAAEIVLMSLCSVVPGRGLAPALGPIPIRDSDVCPTHKQVHLISAFPLDTGLKFTFS